MPAGVITSILDVLVNENIISIDTYKQIKNESLIKKISPEKLLLEHKLVTEEQITHAKSVLYGLPIIDIKSIKIDKNIISLLPIDECEKNKIIIFEKKNGNTYKAAIANPINLQYLRLIEQKINGRLELFIANKSDIKSVLSQFTDTKISSEFSNVIEKAKSDEDIIDISKIEDTKLNDVDLKNTPIAKLVTLIIQTAIIEKSSDIHIEPQENIIRVRYRINGILVEKITIPPALGPALVSRIKILGKMPIDEKRKPLDGRSQIKYEGNEIDLRISSLPTVWGEKIVIRLLRKDLGILNLEDTGMRGNALKVFKEGLKATTGIILVTGPTGSGKTVTVATSMSLLNKPDVNIVSIEDPVEIRIPGINQVQVNEEAGLTFASALRAFLRQDPDIISVGEIRDQETAELAAQASLTGHLVISTLHTNSAAGTLPRLLDMGIEPYIVASTVSICSAQRLCRRICKNCKYAYHAKEEEILELRRVLSHTSYLDENKYLQFQSKLIETEKIPIENTNLESNNIFLFKGRGCEKCNFTGYTGRIGIFEVFKVSEKIGALVMKHASTSEIENQAISEGMIRMVEDGYFKALEGITTIEEVQRVIHT